MAHVHQLYALQEIDTEIREKKQRLGEVLQILKGPSWLLQAQEAQATAVAHLTKLRNQHSNLNADLQALNNKIQTSEKRLYSGKVSNTKELADLQEEIASLQKRTAVLQDEMLELMLLIEEAEEEKAQTDVAMAKANGRWQRESVELQTEKNELAVRFNKLLDMRQNQLALFDKSWLQEYDQLSKKKGGTAVVRVRAGMCMGCRTTISANIIREANEGKKVYCGSCGRIIYPF